MDPCDQPPLAPPYPRRGIIFIRVPGALHPAGMSDCLEAPGVDRPGSIDARAQRSESVSRGVGVPHGRFWIGSASAVDPRVRPGFA